LGEAFREGRVLGGSVRVVTAGDLGLDDPEIMALYLGGRRVVRVEDEVEVPGTEEVTEQMTKGGISRKEYLKLKARERRAKRRGDAS
jgi:hypothetical protein